MNVLGYTESGAIRVIFDGDENESTVPDDMGNRHRVMIAEWEAEGNEIPAYVPPAPVETVPAPSTPAAGAFCITDGVLSLIELPTGISGAYYEDGWISITFVPPAPTADSYLIFAQADVPAKIEQFKNAGSFELVFTDPATGESIEPGRIDLQILKVR